MFKFVSKYACRNKSQLIRLLVKNHSQGANFEGGGRLHTHTDMEIIVCVCAENERTLNFSEMTLHL